MITYMENIFNTTYSYVSSSLRQAANLLGISLEILIYAIIAVLVIGIFFLKRRASGNESPVDFTNNEQENENDIKNDSGEWMDDFTFDPSYHCLGGNIYNHLDNK